MELETWIEIGRGPLFRMAFSLMVLGLLRILALTAIGLAEGYRGSHDRNVPWKEVTKQTLAWLFPAGRLWRRRAVYSTISFLFHIGLLAVPIFLAAHILLWKRASGAAWPALPQPIANWLTLLVLAAVLGLIGGRAFDAGARAISRRQDYFWLLLLAVPFLTGYLCANARIGPGLYRSLMLTHVYSADLILLLIPFSKIAHCVLAPLSQAVTAVAWKFPAGAGARVAATLGYADRPVWANRARTEDKEIYTG